MGRKDKDKQLIIRSTTEKIIMWFIVLIFLIYSVTLIFPFVWIFINSFKSTLNFIEDIWGFPKPFYYQNYIEAFNLVLPISSVSVLGMFKNTIIFVVATVSISLFFNAISAYAVAKYDFKIMSVIHSLALIFMVVPLFGSIAAIYKFFVNVGLYDTYSGVILISLGFFNSTFLLFHAYFKNLSWTYAEAAFIDGAGHFAVFFKIMVPMSVPIFGALAILGVIGVWNDFFTVYMYAPSKATIGVGLNELSNNIRGAYPKLFALMVVSLVPILLIFAIFQKSIMENVSFGGIKG